MLDLVEYEWEKNFSQVDNSWKFNLQYNIFIMHTSCAKDECGIWHCTCRYHMLNLHVVLGWF